MRARVTKWGNSLGLRLPKALSQQLGIEEDGYVEMEVFPGQLVIRPSSPPPLSLEELVGRITPENRHEEMDWGGAVGAEFW